MVREATITQQQVNAAADALRAEGVRPTVRAVRDKLGSGSFATVTRFLNAWQAGQVPQSEAPLSIPPQLQRSIADFIAQSIGEAKAPVLADLADKAQANTDLVLECERLVAQVEATEARLEEVYRDRDAINGKLAQMEVNLNAARQESAAERQAAENARTDLAKDRLRLEAMPQMEDELAKLRKALADERDKRAEAESSAAVAKAMVEALTVQRDQAQADVAGIRQEFAQERKARGEAETRAESMSASVTGAQQVVAEVRELAAERERENTRLQAMLTAALARTAEVEKVLLAEFGREKTPAAGSKGGKGKAGATE